MKSSCYKDFVDTFNTYKERAEVYQVERKLITEERSQERRQRKIQNAIAAVKSVRSHLQHPGARRLTYFRVCACVFSTGITRSKVVLKIHNRFAHYLLRPYILSPTKLLKNKDLQRSLAEQIDMESMKISGIRVENYLNLYFVGI